MYSNNSSSLTWKHKLLAFLENKYYKVYLCIVTIISLCLGDIQKISSIKEADLTFDVIHFLLTFLIFIEIIFYFIADESYGFSLFFFLDIIFIISLILEVTYIYDANFDSIIFIKVEKVLKLLRTLRIGKIITKFNYYFLKISNNDVETEELKKEEFANISSTFINVSSNKIFIFYCFLIVSVIIFEPDLYYENPISKNDYPIQLFSGLKNSIFFKLSLFNSYMEFLKETKNILIFAKLDKIIYINNTFSQKLRKSEISVYSKEDIINNDINDLTSQFENDELFIENLNNVYLIKNFSLLKTFDSEKNNESFILFTESHKNEINIIDSSNNHIYEENINKLKNLSLIPSKYSIQNKYLLIYNIRYYKNLYCQLNIIRTLFSISVFLFIYLLFLFNINGTVLSPIEMMITKIKKMSINPALISELSTNENNQKKSSCLNIFEESQGTYKMNDFQIIENKISKIFSIISFGFGDAGNQIISQILKEGLSVEINPIIPGKKVMGIYGFCDIRNFTDTTEILKEKVMVFVNQVAEIVHQLTADYCGGANKNIGDAFLLVWKFEDQFIKQDINKQGKIELKLKKINRVRQICDMALICFIRILIEINKSFKLAVYRQNKDLNARMKNYKTKLGFGLHLGQSIEGAIGSMFKIDASYLSTNVNMANNLEENTKTFKKELIMSGDFYDYLSDDAKKYLRILDIFKSKNGEITRLYSIDLDLENIPIEKQKDSMFKEDNTEKKLEIIKQKRKMSKILYDDIVSRHKSDIWNEFINDDDDFKLVREKYPDNFVDIYNNGMEHFKNGNWEEAKNCLNSAQELLGEEDPACARNLAFMEKTNFISPSNWKGYREEE